MPIDVNLLRDYKGGDPERVRASELKRRAPASTVDDVLALDREWTALCRDADAANKDFNLLNDEIKALPDKRPTEAHKQRSKELKARAKELAERKEGTEARREAALLRVGNVLHPRVPDFAREEDGEVCVSSWGEFVSREGVIPHHQALWMLGAYEPDKGKDVAGHRGYYLRGPGVLLNQALVNFALSFLVARGFEPVQPPYFMTKQAMSKVSQLSDFDESLYHVGEVRRGGGGGEHQGDDDDDDDKYLIATSEQPLCCLHMNEAIPPAALPYRYAGYSACFRKEAGKYGVDTWGIFRVHQFDKVEQFVVCAPDEAVSYDTLERLRANAEDFLRALELPFKTINVVAGELNLAAAMKYDINAWFPSLKQHKELVSASNCTDYQSRATNTTTVHNGEKRPVHLLNATLCALTRTICCIVENHQGVKEVEGKSVRGVHVPKALVPYAMGRDFFPFVRPEKVFDKQPAASKTAARKKGEELVAAARTTDAKASSSRRASFKVAGDVFPTAAPALADKTFASVEEYTAFLRGQQASRGGSPPQKA